MKSNFSFIPYYKDLLISPAPQGFTAIMSGVPIQDLISLGKELEFDGMRLFIFHDFKQTFQVAKLYGSEKIWKNVSVDKIENAMLSHNGHYKKPYYFFEIKHVKEDGSFLTLGYLVGHRLKTLPQDIKRGLEVYCILIGDFIVRRFVSAQSRQASRYLTSIFEVPKKWELPGHIMNKMLSYLFRLARFNFGAYCSVYNKRVCVEYKCYPNKGHPTFNPNPIAMEVDTSFIRDNLKYQSSSGSLSKIPSTICKEILHKEKRSQDCFSSVVVPTCIDGQVVGVWIFAFSKNNPFADTDIRGVLAGMYDQLVNSYKFIFQKRFRNMIVNPIFQSRDTRLSGNTVFVIMPFTQSWSKELWEGILQPTIKDIDLMPVRADDLYGANIMEDVWQSILKAELIICDTTGRNPNVFYELGIAHTLGKKVILLTQSLSDIPFDLQSYRHIEYNLSYSGGSQLKDTLKRYMKEVLKGV